MAYRLLRIPEVCDRTGLKQTSVYARVREGTLPPAISLGRSRVWVEHEIDAVLGAIISGHDDEDIRELVIALVAQRTAPPGGTSGLLPHDQRAGPGLRSLK